MNREQITACVSFGFLKYLDMFFDIRAARLNPEERGGCTVGVALVEKGCPEKTVFCAEGETLEVCGEQLAFQMLASLAGDGLADLLDGRSGCSCSKACEEKSSKAKVFKFEPTKKP